MKAVPQKDPQKLSHMHLLRTQKKWYYLPTFWTDATTHLLTYPIAVLSFVVSVLITTGIVISHLPLLFRWLFLITQKFHTLIKQVSILLGVPFKSGSSNKDDSLYNELSDTVIRSSLAMNQNISLEANMRYRWQNTQPDKLAMEAALLLLLPRPPSASPGHAAPTPWYSSSAAEGSWLSRAREKCWWATMLKFNISLYYLWHWALRPFFKHHSSPSATTAPRRKINAIRGAQLTIIVGYSPVSQDGTANTRLSLCSLWHSSHALGAH